MKIGVDIDSVCCELMPAVLSIAEAQTGKTVKVHEVTSWNPTIRGLNIKKAVEDFFEDCPETLAMLPMMPYAKPCLKAIEEAGDDITLITGRWAKYAGITVEWVQKNLGDYPIIHCNHGGKAQFGMDVLIDDNLQEVFAFATAREKHGGKAICFAQPWNQDFNQGMPPSGYQPRNAFRAADWVEVLALFLRGL